MPNDRTPRSMQEAFGAYSSTEVAQPVDRMPEAWDQDDLPRDPLTGPDILLLVVIFSTSIAIVGTVLGYLWARFVA